MIFGIGTDLIEVERVAEKMEKKQGFKELVFSANDAKDTENVSRTIRIFAIVFGALFTLFWGLGSLFCSVSALIGAFKIGSGMSAAE